MARSLNFLSWTSLWWYSRDKRLILAGLPALIVGLAGFSLLAVAATTSRQELEVRYLEEAKSAFKAQKYDTAMTCYDRLAYRSDDRPDIVYGRSQTALAMWQSLTVQARMEGEQDKSEKGRSRQEELIRKALQAHTKGMSLAKQLASVANYGPGQMFWARFYQERENPDFNEAEAFLVRALQGTGLDDPSLGLSYQEAHGRLGRIYMAKGQYKQAEEQLQKAVKVIRTDLIYLAELYQKMNRPEEARTAAMGLARYMENRVNANANDRDSRIWWVKALVFLKDFPEAMRVLKEGAQHEPDPSYPQHFGEIYFLWLDHLDATKEDFSTRMDILKKGLEDSQNNPRLLKKLYAYTRLSGNDGKSLIVGLLANKQMPEKTAAMLTMARGVIAIQDGDILQGRKILNDALTLDPDNLEIKNNIAMSLTVEPGLDLKRALELINEVLKQPGATRSAALSGHFHGTRGHILFLMGEWDKANPDLRKALSAYPDNLHNQLEMMVVCEHRNDRVMADAHRQKAGFLLWDILRNLAF